MKRLCSVLVVPMLTLFVAGQPAPPDNDYVHRQFGDSCNLDPQSKPMMADLNGDGVEDLVMVARCKNPMIDQDDKDFRVIDPMNSYYGYGDPKITAGFGQEDPRLKGMTLLIVHGSGAEAWRSATPQAKFVVINIAVKSITLKKMKLNRKKSTTAIYVEEANGDQMTSAVFWDGKKYRYEPMGSSLE